MMTIKTLQDVAISDILKAFNEAFSDYIIKLELTEESLITKIKAENIKVEASVGAFDKGRLVGFILNGLDELEGIKTVYNGGTGVIPEYRGNRIVEKMYGYILPVLKAEGYSKHTLEVIEGNYKALRAYEKIGFKTIRTFSSFKGQVNAPGNSKIRISVAKNLDWETAESFWNVKPSWQNSSAAIKRTLDQHEIIVAFKGDEPVGYAVRAGARIKQFAVKKEERGNGIGRALFKYINSKVTPEPISFINYDKTDESSILFFQKTGLNQFIDLNEMNFFY